jgi:hypothetical protein
MQQDAILFTGMLVVETFTTSCRLLLLVLCTALLFNSEDVGDTSLTGLRNVTSQKIELSLHLHSAFTSSCMYAANSSDTLNQRFATCITLVS